MIRIQNYCSRIQYYYFRYYSNFLVFLIFFNASEESKFNSSNRRFNFSFQFMQSTKNKDYTIFLVSMKQFILFLLVLSSGLVVGQTETQAIQPLNIVLIVGGLILILIFIAVCCKRRSASGQTFSITAFCRLYSWNI